jgi:hypothetical protein
MGLGAVIVKPPEPPVEPPVIPGEIETRLAAVEVLLQSIVQRAGSLEAWRAEFAKVTLPK